MLRKMPAEQLAHLHECEHSGFRVLDARNYYEKMDAQKPRTCQIIQTPYHYGVQPVVALTSTSRKDMNRDDKGYLNTGIVDLFAAATNDQDMLTIDGFEDGVQSGRLRSLADLDPEGVYVLTTGQDGKKISQREAYGQVQRFASTCAEFSHMKVLDEYMEEAMLISGMLSGQKPTPETYWNDYVPSVIDNLAAGERGRKSPITGERYRMMGRVTTMREARAWQRRRQDFPETSPVPVRDQEMPDGRELDF